MRVLRKITKIELQPTSRDQIVRLMIDARRLQGTKFLVRGRDRIVRSRTYIQEYLLCIASRLEVSVYRPCHSERQPCVLPAIVSAVRLERVRPLSVKVQLRHIQVRSFKINVDIPPREPR